MIYLCLFLLSFPLYADVLMPFKTDYCTMFKEGTKENPTAWKDCCLEHDMYYWAGGSIQDRDHADLRLKDCVIEKGYPAYAATIYSGVTLGHLSPIKSKYPWNNGWFGRHEYLPLSNRDKLLIEKEARQWDFPEEVVNLFLENI